MYHVLDARVVLEAVDREVLAVARLLETAVGHLGHEGNVRVDPHAAEVVLVIGVVLPGGVPQLFG